MRYKAFEGFGVEVFEGKKWVRTAYFDDLKEAINFSREVAYSMKSYRIVTTNKWGVTIDELTDIRSCV